MILKRNSGHLSDTLWLNFPPVTTAFRNEGTIPP
jgi:hypothetical protein